MMDVKNDVIGIWRIVMNVRNDGVGVRNFMTDIRMRVCLKFCVEAKGWQRSYRSDRTHVKDMENPV